MSYKDHRARRTDKVSTQLFECAGLCAVAQFDTHYADPDYNGNINEMWDLILK